MFIERIIFDRLTDGLQPYLDDPKLFKQFLLDNGIVEAEAEEARRYFAGDATVDPAIPAKPPHPIMGYARPGGPFPAWAVTLGNESTIQDYLGEDGIGRYIDEDDGPVGAVVLDEDGNPQDVKVRRWEHRYEVWTYTDHPDAALYYYELCKKILVSGRNVFQQADLDELTYQGGDVAPDSRYLPPDVFVRRFSVTLRADQEYVDQLPDDEDSTATLGVGVGTSIDAMIDDGEALAAGLTDEQVTAIEQIRAGVTTYYEGDDDA